MSAHTIAAELRERLPGVGTKKLHKLLYYCQGHHLATCGTPLFRDTISAWDMGPVVASLWGQESRSEAPEPDPTPLSEAELNTIGYVVSRYGALTGADLERLTHGETPWIEADRERGPANRSPRIAVEDIKGAFSAAEAADPDEPTVSRDDVARLLAGATERARSDARVDSIADLRARYAVRG